MRHARTRAARRQSPGLRAAARLVALVLPPLLGACASFDAWTSTATAVEAGQFNRASERVKVGPQVRVPGAVYDDPVIRREEIVTVEPVGETFVEEMSAAETMMPSGARTTLPLGPDTVAAELPPGQVWPVDALVGQINGKPIYADDFLRGMSDRLIQLGQMSDRVAARRELVRLVTQRFEDEVNNRLIISEAESSIPPEARDGLFAWIRQMQEQEIASRGGTRSEAAASLQEQFDMTVEEFIERRKNEALANDLLRKRIEPRTIVTWRDIERAYEKERESYAPGATITIGQIAVITKDNEAKIEEIKAQFASGRSFTDVAQGLGLNNDGVVLETKLGEQGIEGLADLRPEVREKLAALAVGQVSEPFTLGSGTFWVCVVKIDRPPARSLFDADVQLKIRAELQGQRRMQEQIKYFDALRSRWISDDIDQMRMRLLEIALQRYMP